MIKDYTGKIIRMNHRNNIFQVSKNSVSSLFEAVRDCERVIENPPFPALVRPSTYGCGGMKWYEAKKRGERIGEPVLE